jgi:hypothetical protein
MIKNINNILFLLCFMIIGCSPSLIKYGFLPGSDYEIYGTNEKIDLNKLHINYTISDSRNSIDSIECSDVLLERDSELEGDLGLKLFSKYLTTLTDSCNGITDSSSNNIYIVELNAISPKLSGFGFVTVHGLVQFTVKSELITKTYCADIKDGDPDSPVGKYSFATRKTAMREMVSAACRKSIENFLLDVSRTNKKATLK